MATKATQRVHVVHFLNSMGPLTHDADLCLRVFSKSLFDRAYTLYVNLKLGSLHDWEHLVFLFNTNLFRIEVKFSLAELGKSGTI